MASDFDLKEDKTNYAGASLLVTYGKEHFQPCRFQGCDVGPFEITVVIKEGEKPIDAKRRAMRILEEMALEEYNEKIPRFIERVRAVESSV